MERDLLVLLPEHLLHHAHLRRRHPVLSAQHHAHSPHTVADHHTHVHRRLVHAGHHAHRPPLLEEPEDRVHALQHVQRRQPAHQPRAVHRRVLLLLRVLQRVLRPRLVRCGPRLRRLLRLCTLRRLELLGWLGEGGRFSSIGFGPAAAPATLLAGLLSAVLFVLVDVERQQRIAP